MGFSKLIISGSLIELYRYDKPLAPKAPGQISKRTQARSKINNAQNVHRRSDNTYRQRKNFLRLIRANLSRTTPPLFITLTFREALPLQTSIAHYKRFISHLKRRHPHAKHITVVEFQERDAPHFHMLLIGLPAQYGCTHKRRQRHEKCKHKSTCEVTVRRFQSLWLWGFVDVRATNGHPAIAGYMAKYMLKSLQDVRLNREKAYYTSRSLLRPVSLSLGTITPEEIALIGVDNPPLREREFSTEWLGRCLYQQFNRNKSYGEQGISDDAYSGLGSTRTQDFPE